jgi:hypothetical protein
MKKFQSNQLRRKRGAMNDQPQPVIEGQEPQEPSIEFLGTLQELAFGSGLIYRDFGFGHYGC